MRKLFGAFVLILGVVSIAMTARYGWKQADNPVDQAVSAIMYGTIALLAIIFDGAAIRLWTNGWRRVGGFIGMVAALAFIVTLSNSLGSIASRSDAVEAQRLSATERREDNRRELHRLEKALADLGTYAPTDQAAVTAAKIAADAATKSREAECEKRGSNCRDRERDERGANDRLAQVTAAKATTDRATTLESQIAEVKAKLGTTSIVGAINPLAKVLNDIWSGFGDAVSSKMQAFIAFVFELGIVGCMITFEALGHVSAPSTRSGETGKIDTAEPVVLPKPQKPKLVASSTKPVGSVKKIITDVLEPAPGERVEIAELGERYRDVCRSEGKPAASMDAFLSEVEAFCRAIGIRRRSINGHLYLLGVKLVTKPATVQEAT